MHYITYNQEMYNIGWNILVANDQHLKSSKNHSLKVEFSAAECFSKRKGMLPMMDLNLSNSGPDEAPTFENGVP